MIKTKEKNNNPFWKFSKPLLISTLCGAAILAALLAMTSAVLLSVGQIGSSITSAAVIAVSALSAFFAGIIVGRIARKNGLIQGSLTGLLLYFLILIVSVCCGDFQLFTVSSVIRLAVMILAGATGGLISVNKRSRTK